MLAKSRPQSTRPPIEALTCGISFPVRQRESKLLFNQIFPGSRFDGKHGAVALG